MRYIYYVRYYVLVHPDCPNARAPAHEDAPPIVCRLLCAKLCIWGENKLAPWRRKQCLGWGIGAGGRL